MTDIKNDRYGDRSNSLYSIRIEAVICIIISIRDIIILSKGEMRMKRLAILVVALVAMAATNPPRSDYIAWAKDKVIERSSPGLESGLVSFFGGPLISSTTTSKDLYFGTIYTTSYGGREITVLGVMNRFIPLK